MLPIVSTRGVPMENIPPIYPRLSADVRKRAGFTQAEVVREVKNQISINSLRNYEAGLRDTPASVLMLLSKLYECSIETLLDHTFFSTDIKDYTNFSTAISTLDNDVPILKSAESQAIYHLDQNINTDRYEYRYVVLEKSDETLHLPAGTRFLVQLAGSKKIDIIEEEERIYLLTSNKYRFPNKKNKKNHIRGHTPNRISTTFLSKASLLNTYVDTKLVIYYDAGKLKTTNLRSFRSMVDGIVIKIIIDCDK
jgi:transcriptional regulator with XRE-family HTH domain